MPSTQTLPLFPLNTVLFPGMPLELHIFEPRYREMVNWCVETQSSFGVVLIRRGNEALGPVAEPYEIGCTARIVQLQRLPDGRMNITVVGEERFRVASLDYSLNYLQGRVETYPLEVAGAAGLSGEVARLRSYLKRYMDKLATLANTQLAIQRLPTEPRALAYMASIVLQIPSDDKQSLLQHAAAGDLLAEACDLYRRELALLDTLALGGPPVDDNGFTLN